MATQSEPFDRELLARRRARWASSLPEHDFLIQRAAEDIAARLEAATRPFPLALDLGARWGALSRRLLGLPAVGAVVSAEAVPSLLAQCPGMRLACDEEMLPFADASLDLVVSALGLHLVNDLPGTLVRIRRALRPDGLFLAAVLGGRTLFELREALLAAEAETHGGASPRVAPFADVRDYGALLQRAGFALPVADSDVVAATYATPFDLMREIRVMDGGNVLTDRSRRPLGRATLLRAAAIHGQRFPAEDGRVRATFEIVYLTGWAPAPSQPRPLRPGSARARLADALGVAERSGGAKARPGRT